ncbi:ParA family protein [Clostridium akagii]|uniref:ParA family protein n=1 Tax=Clostridium akagii TaxID=91623 RepID=UPI00047E83BE|nr:AAA family ATPase [Clostridium akagii]
MKVFSVVNIKGGVGKTISTINIGACLQELGYKVLIVDLDSQGNASKILKCYSMDDESVTEVLLNKETDIKKVIKNTDYENFNILPSNVTLAFAERQILMDTTRSQQNRLARALKVLENDYDFCIIDCPPSLSMVTINALVASNEVIVPIKLDQFALDGLGYLLDSINEIKEEFNHSLKFTGCFITMDNATTVNRVVKEHLRKTLNDKILNTTIKNNVKVVESTYEQIPVVFSNKRATASLNYRQLTKEILNK